jgi:hypothetical protein
VNQAGSQTREVTTSVPPPDSGENPPKSFFLAMNQRLALEFDGLGGGAETRQSATHDTRRENRPERER